SSRSASNRKKTGAMFTYPMRPSLIIDARTSWSTSAGAIHHCVGQGLELLPMWLRVEVRPRASSVVERCLAGAADGVGRCNTHERAVDRPAGQRSAHHAL